MKKKNIRFRLNKTNLVKRWIYAWIFIYFTFFFLYWIVFDRISYLILSNWINIKITLQLFRWFSIFFSSENFFLMPANFYYLHFDSRKKKQRKRLLHEKEKNPKIEQDAVRVLLHAPKMAYKNTIDYHLNLQV